METSALALFLAGKAGEARSALPDAPVVATESAGRPAVWASFRGALATSLHRAAWAVEPDTRRGGLRSRTGVN
jgi:hypothetical protein